MTSKSLKKKSWIKNSGFWATHIFFIFLIAVTFRHFSIRGDHLWTGEGARFSWSMRLRGKVCAFEVKEGQEKWKRASFKKLRFWQAANLDDPFLFYLFVKTVLCPTQNEVYGKIHCRAISHGTSQLINPQVNLCQASYSFLYHNDWIAPDPGPWDPGYLNWFVQHQSRERQR